MRCRSLTSSRGTEVRYRVLALLAVMLCVLPAAAAGGSFVIDTAGVTAAVGETVQIPVSVFGAEGMSGYQIQLNTGNTASAKISVNPASASGLTYSDGTGILIWAGALQGKTISGDAELFLLDVTPKTATPVPLTLSVTQVFSGTAPAVAVPAYFGYETVLVIGKNTGEGNPLNQTPPEAEIPDMPQTDVSSDYPMPDVPPDSATKSAFPVPYWIMIVLAVTALVLLITLRKNV